MQRTVRLSRFACSTHTSSIEYPANPQEAALHYARRGWYVLPLYATTLSGECACGQAPCPLAGRHTYISAGVEDATTDHALILQWWQQFPAASVGIATGHGLVVLEVDPARGGDLSRLLDFYALPETALALTSQGTWQLYFTYNPALSIRSTYDQLGKGITSYGDGNLVQAPLATELATGTAKWVRAIIPVQLPGVLLPAILQRSLPAAAWQGTDVQPSAAARSLAVTLQHKGWLKPLPPPVAQTLGDMDEKIMSQHHLPDKKPADHPPLMPLDMLLDLPLPEPAWLIPGLLRTGVTLLMGKPFSGKSCLALEMALAVAHGSSILGRDTIGRGDVLFLGLEDSMWSMYERTQRLLRGRAAPANVTWAGAWEPLSQGGLADLEDWLNQHRQARLIVIDTVASIAPANPRKKGKMAFLTPLKMLAEQYNIAILLVQQLQGHSDANPHDMAQMHEAGGMAREAGGALVLQRDNDEQIKVHVMGRDIETRFYSYPVYQAERQARETDGNGPE